MIGKIWRKATLWEVVFDDFLEDNDSTDLYLHADYRFISSNATFTHTSPDACEYILHVGDEDYFHEKMAEMEEFGCTDRLKELYREAYRQSVRLILFYHW